MNFSSFNGHSDVSDRELAGLMGDDTVVPETQMEVTVVPETQMEDSVVQETQMDVVDNPKNEVIFHILHHTCLSIVIPYSSVLCNSFHHEMYCVFALEFAMLF